MHTAALHPTPADLEDALQEALQDIEPKSMLALFSRAAVRDIAVLRDSGCRFGGACMRRKPTSRGGRRAGIARCLVRAEG